MARKGTTPAAALRRGLAQIRERRYEADLLAAGASVVHAFAVAFDGKRVWVKSAGSAAAPKAPKKQARRPPKKRSKRTTPAKKR